VKIENHWLDVSVDGSAEPMSAYVAQPAEPGPHPTVLVGFEMFGITDYVRAVADRIAALGYTAVVPDFYHRSGSRIALPATAEGRSRGLELLSHVTRDTVDRDLQALLSHFPGPHGMVGLSVGGHLAYYAATRFPLAAVATFYPGWLTDDTIPLGRPTPTVDLTPGIKGRLLFLVGDGDHLFTPPSSTRSPPDSTASTTTSSSTPTPRTASSATSATPIAPPQPTTPSPASRNYWPITWASGPPKASSAKRPPIRRCVSASGWRSSGSAGSPSP